MSGRWSRSVAYTTTATPAEQRRRSDLELVADAIQAAQFKIATAHRVVSRRSWPARVSPHPAWLRSRRSPHKPQCDSLLGLASQARMTRSLIDQYPRDGT
jgi:hypothetical protein